MNADKLTDELNARPTLDRLQIMPHDIDRRRGEIRARLGAISRSGAPGIIPAGAARQAAQSVEQQLELDREEQRLAVELDVLSSLERQIFEAVERVKVERIRAAAPAARRKLPAAARTLRAALEQLDAAIVEHGALVEALGDLAGLPGEPFPLDDDELAELLELRNAAWRRRDVRVLQPPASHPRSFALFYEQRPYGTIITRRAPGTTYLPDVVAPERAGGGFRE